MKLKYFFLSLLIAAFALQVAAQSASQREKLLELSAQLKIKSQTEKAEAVRVATEKGWAIRTEDPDGRVTELMRLDDNGMPMYYTTYNAEGAALINSDELYPGGAAGLNLSGAGQTLGEWDAGGVLLTHQELVGRVTQKDSPTSTHYHSTHVAGTMIASGVKPAAKGMSYEANLDAYDWKNDVSEMAAAAADGMNVSQHSYGQLTGWAYGIWYNNVGPKKWHWFGDYTISQTEDYYWGFYSSEAQYWDYVAQNAPNYLIVKSAGNDRGEGITSGEHYALNHVTDDWELSNTARSKDGGATGYQTVAHSAISKNVMSVGAVYNSTAMSTFSGWGPTDDGRIKPDIVAKGVGVYSTMDGGDDAYDWLNGTSMAGPMVSGSIGLLLEHQENLYPGVKLLSSTIKGLITHTATDLGKPGPDYSYGWGLMNTEAAAGVMTAQKAAGIHIYESSLSDGETYTIQIEATGSKPLKATLVWTDPYGAVPAPALNPTDANLVNDLDMRLTAVNGTVSSPYILDPANPATDATTGDNFRDNIEEIYIANPGANQLYTLQINHKGILSSPQSYSLIITGNKMVSTYLFNAADDAGNYGGGWNDGSNQGNGFGAWEFLPGAGGGNYIGGTGLGDPTFGIYSGGGGDEDKFIARREFGGAIPVGTSIGLQMGYTGVDGGGEIGISFFSQGSFRFVIKFIGGGSKWQLNDGGSDFETSIPWAGNTPLIITLTRGTDNKYSIQMNQGGDSYTGTDYVANSGSFAIDRIEIFSTKQGGGQNVGFNDLTVVSDLDQIPANVDAIVKGNLTFDTDLVLDNLTIETGNSVAVAPTKNLTVNATIDNQAGTAAFVLQSDATGTASLLHNTNDVDMTIQRYVTGDAVTTNAKYHTVSVPLTQSSNPLSGLFMGAYLFEFDQTIQDYVTMGTSTTTPLPVDQGYLIYYPGASTTFEFTGKANNGSFSTDVAYPPFGDNYNLVPNPYPSAIDWNAASGWTKTNMDNAIYIYNTSSSSNGNPVWASFVDNVGANGGSRYIPAGQAFFVRSNAAAPVLDMTNEVRVHDAQPFFKDAEEEVETLRLFAHANGYTDESVVCFVEESTTGFDGQYDALKFKNWNEAPNIYSLALGKTELSINSIPYSTEAYQMELGFEWNQDGEATIELQGMESFGDWVSILFEDRLTGIRFDLRDQNTYSFQHEAEADPSRFVLHFMGVTAVDELQSDKSDYHIWSADKQLHISNPATLPALLEVFDLQGRLLYSSSLSADAKWTIGGLPEAQLLLIRLSNDETVVNQKVFIR
ncbi:MAG: S8 family serine peptidase [Bacteroidales bacterium]|jgi:hypothetical protein|nr:S8 family serine peptidase [Bacteroidales bacterium]